MKPRIDNQKKIFLGKAFLFLICLLFGNFLFNSSYIHMVLSNSRLYRIDAQFAEIKDSVQILVVGDSHPLHAVDTRDISNGYNLATSGENIIQTYYRLRYYLEVEPVDLKLVILPIDLHSFSSFRMDRFSQAYYWDKYIDFIELGKFKNDVIGYARLYLLGYITYIDGVSDTIEYLSKMVEIQGNRKPLVRGYAIHTENLINKNNAVEYAENRVHHQLGEGDHFSYDATEYFLRILNMLQAHDIKTVLVKYPVAREYYQEAKYYQDINAYYASLDKILENGDYRYLLLDYHDLYWDEYAIYFDVDHLNEPGAKQFTQVLMSDLQAAGYLP